MVINANQRAARAAVDSIVAWEALLHREEPIPAGELLDMLQQVNRQNERAPIPVEAARAAFRVFWQAQLDDYEL